MFRLPVSCLLLSCLLTTGFGAEVDPTAAAALEEGNAALAAANNDPSQNLVAALAYAKALPAYEAAGDQDTAAEIRSVIFWCKKRMNQVALERFVQSKGEAGGLLATAVAQVDQPVAVSEAKAYLAKADDFAQKNPKQSLKIAIRYFEVADRFQGTQESLKAQRLSLDALQRSMASRGDADPQVTAELHSTPIQAGDLPDSAQKLVATSNQATDAIAAKASRVLALERQKAVEVVLKEAEAAQRKGELEQMIAHQHQADDLDKDVSGLSKAAAAAVEGYHKARPKTITKAAGEVIAERRKLLAALARVQKDETKQGNTAGALAIKSTIDAITQNLADASAASLAGQKEAVRPFVLKPDGGVFLGRLVMKNPSPGVVVAKDEASAAEQKVIMVEGERCFEFIVAYAPSSVGYDIPPGARQFTAYGLSTGYQSVKFLVNIDGKKVFTSEMPTAYPNKLVPVNVMLPEGAKKIELIVDPCGDNVADHSFWAYPYFAR